MPRISAEYEQAQLTRIIDGAALVFAEFGYRSTTIDQIAKALDLSKGAIYVYFASKEELFVATLRLVFERRFRLLSTAYDESDPVLAKFEKIVNCLGDLVAREDYVYMRLSLEGFLESDRIPALQAVKAESYARFSSFLAGLLVEGKQSGDVDPAIDVSTVSAALIAVSDGLMMHSLVPERGIDPDRVREVMFGTFSRLLANKAG